jgi:classical protein kinase C
LRLTPTAGSEDRRPNLRKPLSGTLQVSVRSARDIDHTPTPRIGRSVRESTVVVKVEDTPRARTHPSRTDRWQEDFEVAVDNANEIEVTVYDRVGTSMPVPVGMLWIRISDIVEELRKKKFGQVATFHGNPAGAAGWVTAEDVGQAPDGGGAGGIGGGGSGQDMSFHNGPAGQPVPLGPTSEGVEAWFAVEPAGAIFLRLNFVKQNVRKRPYDARLGRQGAVRKRKEDVAEINGHKFISRQFYQIIRCALCGELLLNAAGSQCEDCRYTCHKKCAQKVVTKCISKSNAEAVSRSSTGLMSRDTDVHAGPRRGQDQAPHPAPLRAAHEHRRQLVLPLRLHPAAWPQERAQVHG